MPSTAARALLDFEKDPNGPTMVDDALEYHGGKVLYTDSKSRKYLDDKKGKVPGCFRNLSRNSGNMNSLVHERERGDRPAHPLT